MIAIHDNDVIFGFGETATDAYSDAVDNNGWDVERFLRRAEYSQITKRLVDFVREHGGSIAFQRVNLGAGQWEIDLYPDDDPVYGAEG